MSRYIDADALKSQKEYCEERHEYIVPVAKIDWTPTVDAVGVVRCRDCKHAEPYKRMNGATGYYCRCKCSVFEYADRHKYTPVRESDDFCSYGERRTDNG